MFEKKVKICVIGSGIIGTTSALAIIESIPDIDITIIADKWTPNTTSDVSGAVIYPPNRDVKKWIWMKQTSEWIERFRSAPNYGKHGIGLISLFELYSEQNSDLKPYFPDRLISCRELSDKEMKLFPNKWRKGTEIVTYFVECAKFLPFLLQNYKSMGGKVVNKKIDNLKELVGKYDIVINCSGVEANNLVNDKRVHPVRGQVLRVIAPWIKHAIFAGNNYIIPNTDFVVLGRTEQINDWNINVNSDDSKEIWENCCSLCPSIKTAQIVKESVGLRPGRDEVRLDTEVFDYSNNKLYIVHNYGHGSLGVTLSWGCAQEVRQLVNDIIINKFENKYLSKL